MTKKQIEEKIEALNEAKQELNAKITRDRWAVFQGIWRSALHLDPTEWEKDLGCHVRKQRLSLAGQRDQFLSGCFVRSLSSGLD